jgi:hypothetical protein
MKLFTIGDSISQGFMSLAAARTDLSYSTIIANAMQLADYRFATWPKGGHPLNVELLFRRLENLAGPNVNILEWPLVLARTASLMDEVEDYYEREEGRPSAPDPGGHDYFHNIAVRGYDVADAWLVNATLCYEQIKKETKFFFDDGVLALPSAGFYRTALNVLNPSRDPDLDGYTALKWLEHHHTGGADAAGVENLVLWLGSNNALGTVVDLEVIATNDPTRNYHAGLSQTERLEFNLWSPAHFEEDYRTLLDKVDGVMSQKETDWRVFVGTVPAVTIAPLAKGVGEPMFKDDPFGVLAQAKYYKYYTYFLFDEEYAHTSETKITRAQAYAIDSNIAEYNETIRNVTAEKNAAHGADRYHVVEINRALLEAAYKRNNENPIYDFPDEIRQRFPMVDTRFYHATSQGVLEQGGLFSLDGVHPSAIGQGLVAHEFMKVINAVRGTALQVDWDAVYAADDLYMKPLRMMPWLRRQDDLAKLFLNISRGLGREPRSRMPRPPSDRERGPF